MHRTGSDLSFYVVRQHDVCHCVVNQPRQPASAGRLPRVKLRRLQPATFSGFRGTRAAPVRAATTLTKALATSLAAAAVLSGCQVMSPIQTTAPYQPANGVSVDLGAVQIRDLVVVSRAKGEAGTLSGMVVNTSAEPVTISFAAGAAGGSVMAQAPADTQTRLSGVVGTAPVTLPSVDAAAAGGIVRLTVSTPAGGASEVSVPVLPPDGIYAKITPAPLVTIGP